LHAGCEGFVHAGLLGAAGQAAFSTDVQLTADAMATSPGASELPKFVLLVVSAIRLPAVPIWQTGQ
jgi:hypothetical protein